MLMDPKVQRELWISFASLIRAYGAAHGLNSKHQAIVEVSTAEILLRVGTRWLRFTQTEMSADNDFMEVFQINEDGSVSIGKTTEDMDLTAERLIGDIMRYD